MCTGLVVWEGVALEKVKEGQCDWGTESTGELSKVEERRQAPHPGGAGP